MIRASLAIFLAAALAFPRQPARQGQPAAAAPEAVIKVQTRIVQVNVIVEDRKGRPVEGLTKEDFEIKDNKESVPIKLFAVESAEATPKAAPKPPPQNTFTNRFEYLGGTPPAVTVILLDSLNTKFEDTAYAKRQIVKFLQQLRPNDRVALYTLGTGLRILHDFTSDATPLLRALAKHNGGASPELEAGTAADGLDENVDGWLKESTQTMSDYYNERRARMTFEALEDIAHHSTSIPGRKNLIWVSGGFPFNMGIEERNTTTQEARTFTVEAERTARALNNANMAIYPVDARGLFINPYFTAVKPSVPASLIPADTGKELRAMIRTQDTMNIMAERTGGKAFHNTNDLSGSIRQAVNDARLTYILGFAPAHSEWKGLFREIKVTVKKPGLKVRHRLGYYAFADVPQTEDERKAELDRAVKSPIDSTGLLIAAVISKDPKPRNPRAVELIVNVDMTGTLFETQGEARIALVDVTYVQTLPGGQLKGVNDSLPLKVTAEGYDKLVKNGLTMRRPLTLLPDATQIRIVVRDSKSGSVGSVTLPLSKTNLQF